MNNNFKVVCLSLITLSAVSLATASSYTAFIINPQQEAFRNCLNSYSADSKDVIYKIIRLSPADFCKHGYDFGKFAALAIKARTFEEAKYTDPHDFAVKESIEKAISEKIKKEVGIN